MPKGIYKRTKPPWNKGKKELQVAWNRGLTMDVDKRITNAGGKASQKVLKKLQKGFYNPETGRKGGRIGGKIGGKITAQKHPNQFREIGQIGGLITAQRHPNLARKRGKYVHKLYPNLANEMGKLSVEANRRKKPYIWKGVHFMSKSEMKIAKVLLNKPIEGINCHIKIDTKIIDFYPQSYDKMFQNCLVEYHPWDFKNRTTLKYRTERLSIINNSKYKNTKLIIINNSKLIN